MAEILYRDCSRPSGVLEPLIEGENDFIFFWGAFFPQVSWTRSFEKRIVNFKGLFSSWKTPLKIFLVAKK